MPQTRFVLTKAIALGLKPLVVVNKVDKPQCTPEAVHEQVFDLMFNIGASEEQLNFKTVYGSARDGWMSPDWRNQNHGITYLLDKIVEEIPAPEEREGTSQMLVTSLDYSNFTGRIAIGRVHRGTLKAGQQVTLVKRDGTHKKTKIKDLFVFEGFERVKAKEVHSGEICALTGASGFDIGDTIADPEEPEGLPAITIDEPTMSMTFTVNDSPFFGKEGHYVTSRHIKERLEKEAEKNLAMKIEETDNADSYIVYGRGVMHLSVLIETMRREGYELQIGQPRVIIKEIDGQKHEPVEELYVDVPEPLSGKAIESINQRSGTMIKMEQKGDLMHLEFEIPSRGIIGLRNQLLTQTGGEAVMSHRFKEFQPHKGEIPGRKNGSLIAQKTGESVPYALNELQERGRFFVPPNEQVYAGQVVGENNRANDITVNITKTKKLTNMRAAGSDEKTRIAPPVIFSLEEALEFIQADEYVEATPQSVRFRKQLLQENERKRGKKIT
jgi:GTP-binding protein